MNSRPRPKAKPSKPARKGKNDAARLGGEIQSRIGTQLRAMYDDIVNQGVPDRFADLLSKIDASAAKQDE